MTSRISTIVIDAVQTSVVAEFWCRVLDWEVLEEDDDFITIGPADRSWPMIDVVPVPVRKTVKNRLHLDLRADGTTTTDELERLLDIGAHRVDIGQGPDVSWVVLSDPEGNEFCLLSRTVDEARATE